MIDVKILRNDPALVVSCLKARGSKLNLSCFDELDSRRRSLISRSDSLKSDRKSSSKQIGQLIKAGGDPSEIKAQVSCISDEIKVLDNELHDVELAHHNLLATLPNFLDPATPMGNGEEDNVELSRWGSSIGHDFVSKDHVDLGVSLGILDFESAVKITGARFALLRGDGARLERALINFMTDLHHEQGYFEVIPPFIVNSDSMFATGQFPKMKDDVFKLEGHDYFLIPTAEVPVTNIHRDEILNEAQLPIFYQAYTPCFRSEAGSYGRDTRGLIRQHQFNKVELVKFVKPESSEQEHDNLLEDAAEVLRRLELPYRVMLLCSRDISFSASKCYDLEVWLPGQNAFREISSCSNFKDFQARRAKIRYKGKQKEFVHTINGSGLAVGRTLVAILENHQQADGRIRIPDALRPYMKHQEFIEKQL